LTVLDEVTAPESVLRRSYAFDRLGAPAAVLDASGVIVETNEAWRIFAVLNEALPATTGIGVDYLDVCDRSCRSGLESAGLVAIGLRSILDGERGSFELEYACPSPIEDRWFLLRASTAPVEAGAGLVLFHINVTARKLLEQRLGEQSNRDPRTGLPDRRAGMRLIEAGLAHAAVGDARLTLIKLGIAGFSAVDDELGRPALEELAVQVTARAMRALRADDHFCPLGPDELVAVCAGLDDAALTEIVARLEHAMSVPFQVGVTKVALAVDIGVASAELGSTAIGLLAAASKSESGDVPSVRRSGLQAAAGASAPNDVRVLAASFPDDAAASSMRIARAQRDAVVAGSNDLALYLEPDGTIVWASPAIKSVLGIDPATLLGRSGFDMLHPDDRERTLAELGAIANLGDQARSEHRVVIDDGTVRWVEESVTNLVDDPDVGYIVVNLHDITDRKQLELDLRYQATHDALTGLANRALLLEQLNTALDAADPEIGVGVVLFDVDRFKLINDSFGHDRGDLVLAAIADVLRDTLGPQESAARFDSDAFVVVIRQCRSSEQALELAARIRARLADGLAVGEDRFHPTFSIGIVVARHDESAMTALRNAETAMYRAKEHGRDRAACFDPSQKRNVVDRFELERDLRRGIECGELRMVFQPVIDLQTDSVSSCEALVRWHHPERGTIGPDDFIPVAKETRLIVPLGRWVLRHSLAAAAEWPETVQVAVNLSAPELAEPDLVAFVHGALVELGFPASRLVLEITETAVIHDLTAASRTIGALRALGVSIVIDDFGTGYTSLSFLRDYRIDGLKIDRSFVANLDHGSGAIIDAIIRMSAAFGLDVIAEGVETEAQLADLRALGCRYIQGYLMSRPVEADDLPFMHNHPR